MRVRMVVLVLVALAAPASAQSRDELIHTYQEFRSVGEHAGQPYPVIELVTMGVGSLIWERHGHIALCVDYGGPHVDCFNYGVADFLHPMAMATGFFRGTHSFWVDKMNPENMLATYLFADRTIFVQPLPLDEAQKKEIIDKLEFDILEPNKYYAYDHFWDNCTTRARDIIDHATHGALSSMTEPTDGRTYRDLARAGFFGMRVPLLITDVAMGRVTDRVPTYYERMFLPDYLREAVQTKWKIQPVAIYTRAGPPPLSDGPSGRVWFTLLLLVLSAPAWATRLWGRFERTGLAVALAPQLLLGTIFWFLAIISPLPYVRWNESCLVLLPLDVVLLFLSPARRVLYARARVAMLGLILLLMLVGVLVQPIWPLVLWALVPSAVVGFMPARARGVGTRPVGAEAEADAVPAKSAKSAKSGPAKQNTKRNANGKKKRR